MLNYKNLAIFSWKFLKILLQFSGKFDQNIPKLRTIHLYVTQRVESGTLDACEFIIKCPRDAGEGFEICHWKKSPTTQFFIKIFRNWAYSRIFPRCSNRILQKIIEKFQNLVKFSQSQQVSRGLKAFLSFFSRKPDFLWFWRVSGNLKSILA